MFVSVLCVAMSTSSVPMLVASNTCSPALGTATRAVNSVGQTSCRCLVRPSSPNAVHVCPPLSCFVGPALSVRHVFTPLLPVVLVMEPSVVMYSFVATAAPHSCASASLTASLCCCAVLSPAFVLRCCARTSAALGHPAFCSVFGLVRPCALTSCTVAIASSKPALVARRTSAVVSDSDTRLLALHASPSASAILHSCAAVVPLRPAIAVPAHFSCATQ
ncbi:hypothetical protein, conserved in T. vivax, partial [Trypanosoma vivax Y486]